MEHQETKEVISQSTDTGGSLRLDEQDNEITVELVDLFYLYLGHIWQIFAFMALGILLAFVVTHFLLTPKYKTTAKVYVVSASKDSVVNLSDLQIGSQLTSDYKELLVIHPLLEDVIKNLGLDMEYEDLVKMINVSTPPDTRLLYITVESSSPTQAANIANEVAELSMVYLPKIMECDPPNMADRAIVPSKPSSPSYSLNIVLGAFATTALYCVVLFIQFCMNDTFTGPDEITRYLGEAPLATIPEGSLSDFNKKHGALQKMVERRRGRRKK